MQLNKLLNHRSNQRAKLKKTSLNKTKTNKKKKKCKAFIDPKHTHTYTLNKSNQFYISKISQDSLV